MGDFERTVREFKRTLTGGRQKTAPLDIMGKVTRVEDGVAWVRFAGSEVGDTPVRMNIDCKEGDVVQVRSSDGKAWIVGNQSAPPTDDSKAKEVEQKTEKFAERIKSVEKVAGDAEEVANAVNQKVWSDEAGLHIADGKKDAAAERNSIWNSLGMLFRKGLNPILGILTGDNPRVAIYDGHGSASENEVAHFGVTSSVGRNDDYNISIAPENFELNNGSNNGNATLFRVGASGNPTSERYQKTETFEEITGNQGELEYDPINGTNITVNAFKGGDGYWEDYGTLTFTAGTSETKTWSGCTFRYVAPKTFTMTGSNLILSLSRIKYTAQSDSIDLGVLQFGSRQDGGIGNNSATIGNELVAPYSYQTVVGKHNAPEDAPFIVGVGSPEENKNAFTVGWNGDIRSVSSVRPDKSILYNRTVVYDCKNYFVPDSSDMVVKNAYVALCGRICQLTIVFTNTGSVASSGNFISGQFTGGAGTFENKTAPPLPRYAVNGASYYGKTSISGGFGMTGTLTIRNASPAALTIGSSSAASISFTYIVLDDFWTP